MFWSSRRGRSSTPRSVSTRTRKLTLELLEERTLLAVIPVTTNADTGAGSLRQAILTSNASVGVFDTITFNIPGSVVASHIISPTSALPDITDPVLIDGTIEPDYSTGVPIIQLDGLNAGAGANGLKITAGGSTVKGLAIYRFSGSGIELRNGGGNTIDANILGTDRSGTSAALGNGNAGVFVIGSDNNLIGRPIPSFGANLISGNTTYGVALSTGADNNTVQGNRIGTNTAGTGALANGVGVDVRGHHNTIGGAGVDQTGNRISGNNQLGLRIFGALATNNTVAGNWIGRVITTEAALLRNGYAGVYVTGADFNTIGGPAGDSNTINVISGNSTYGIQFAPGADDNTASGNRIGLNLHGTAAVGNGVVGVDSQGRRNKIGGTGNFEYNVISGNGQFGVRLIGAGAFDNVVEGNRIGTDFFGGTAVIPNGVAGVEIDNSPNNRVGGTVAGASNLISANGTYGVRIQNAGAPATSSRAIGSAETWAGPRR